MAFTKKPINTADMIESTVFEIDNFNNNNIDSNRNNNNPFNSINNNAT